MSNGQTEQIGICDLPVADKKIRGNVIIENSDVILPECMGSLLDNMPKQS